MIHRPIEDREYVPDRRIYDPVPILWLLIGLALLARVMSWIA